MCIRVIVVRLPCYCEATAMALPLNIKNNGIDVNSSNPFVQDRFVSRKAGASSRSDSWER